jgi:hypothetical protein
MFGTSRFAIVPRNLGRQLFFRQNKCVKKPDHFFLKEKMLVSLSQENQTAHQTLIREQFFHTYPRHWAM